MSEKPLGELLVEKGFISRREVEQALAIQKETKGLLGEILVSQGFIAPFLLYQVIAEQMQLPYVGKDLGELVSRVEKEVIELFSSQELLRFHFFPLSRREDTLVVATTLPQNTHLDTFLEEKLGIRHVEKQVITPYEMDWLIHFFFQEQFLKEAVTGLFFRSPQESAARVFTPFQWIMFTILVILFSGGLCFFPSLTFTIFFAFANLFYLFNILFKFLLSISGSVVENQETVTEEEIRSLQASELPIYTILLPLHREPFSVIAQLVSSIRELDYPQEKLDILFLIEEDDQETLHHCKKAKPPYNVRFITIPKGFPKTKPRACNFGLLFARGEFLTIYDAEDIPERDQLKKAVVAFRKSPPEIICFQAALNFYNQRQNLLTRLFTLEYSYWFDYLLPGLFALKLPIPLGGTSNHFRTDALRTLGGWDPFNVTEDADLGMRASYRGYRVGILNSTTYEEANSALRNWIRQRSRWLKGYLQTFLVHNRNPWKIMKQSGFKGWLTLQIFIGGTPIGEAASVVLWGLFIFWLLARKQIALPFLPPTLIYIGSFNLLWGNFFGVYLSMLAVFRRNLHELVVFSLLNPTYWLLAGIAAWKGIFQLLSRPFFWEKTIHGLHQESKTSP